MEGRGRGRGRGEGGRGRGFGGRGRGDGGRGGGGTESGGRGGDRERSSGYDRGHQGDHRPRGSQFPDSGRGGGSRQGDWTCSSCNFNNYARNSDCYRCHTPKSGAGGSSGDGSKQGDWTCPNCNFNNYARNSDCYRCHTPKSGAGGSSGDRGRQGGDGGYQRGGGRGRGDRGFSRGGRGRGGASSGRGGDEIDWAAQEAMETASQTSTKSDPASKEQARLEKIKLNELPAQFAGLDLNYAVIPRRINTGSVVGTRGRKIIIEVNHLRLKFDPEKKVAIHYDCNFEPDKVSRIKLRKVMAVVRDRRYPKRSPAFDGKKNLYSCNTPLFKEKEIHETVELPAEQGDSRPLVVKVTIKEVEGESRIDLSEIPKFICGQVDVLPQKAVQVMEIVLRSAPATVGFTQVGRSFFTPPKNPIPLGHGMELYHGFFQSVVLGWQTFLNVDVAHKGFPEARNVADVMCQFKKTKRHEQKPLPNDLSLRAQELEAFTKFIKNIRVNYKIPGVATSQRKHTVVGVKRPANQQRFLFKRNENDRPQEMTVEQYMREEKRYKLRYPHLPCLHVGDPKRTVYVPPELCDIIVGQIMMKKLDPDQTRVMIKEAATRPDDRKQKILDAVNRVNHNQDDCVQEFGIDVGQQFTRVQARILPTPAIQYRNGSTNPANGEWKEQEYMDAVSLQNWAIASASSDCKMAEIRNTVDTLRRVSREVGMTISEPTYQDILVDDWRTSDDELERVLLAAFRKYKEKNIQIVVMLIPDKAYSKVKRLSEITVGLLTQCIKQKTLDRMDPSTGKNLLKKINAKLNGTNHTVIRNASEKLKGPDRVMALLRDTMLMGADVTHPSPDQKLIPSVAAVTASHDALQFQYNMQWRLQDPRQEIIRDLYDIVIKQLRIYKIKNGKYPARIIFYRDGVSEGQFIQVLQREMTLIKSACEKETGVDLPITFLVVQKRHHTRFFPTAKDHMDRKGNVPPGTVVDTTITHPTEADFYMVSHASLQGTSRPTKYHKLWDDNQINEDDLEELTFFLCHMFSRCTRSVSYPAPTYYAHLAAARGRVYLEDTRVNFEQLQQEMDARRIQDNIINGSPMFFT